MKSRKVTASAPGKVILFGEHAVVYDRLGIVFSIGKRCRVKVSPNSRREISISSDRYRVKKSFSQEALSKLYYHVKGCLGEDDWEEINEIYKENRLLPSCFVVGSIFEQYGFLGAKIVIESAIPKGLGSSSAAFSALSAALLHLLKEGVSKKEISDFTYQGDLIAHGGSPSGIDNNAVTYGGYLKFRKSDGFEVFQDSPQGISLIIVDSGEDPRTASMVRKVRMEKEKNPSQVEKILDDLHFISEEALEVLSQDHDYDYERLGTLMTDYYQSLRILDISTEKLDYIVELALEKGALGAKPTGGWGGGCCLILAESSENRRELIRAFKKKNFSVLETEIGTQGTFLV